MQTIRLHAENTGGRPAGPGAAELAVPGLLLRAVPAFTGREAELTRLAGLAGGGGWW